MINCWSPEKVATVIVVEPNQTEVDASVFNALVMAAPGCCLKQPSITSTNTH